MIRKNELLLLILLTEWLHTTS